MHVFLVTGWWVTVDFDAKYKFLSGETRAYWVPMNQFMRKRKLKTRIYLIIPTPYNIRLQGWRGLTYIVLPSRQSKLYATMASRQHTF